MAASKVGKATRERLFRIVKSYPPIYRVAANAFRRYEELKYSSEFHSRISKINPDQYLDISHKPNLNVIILVVDSLRNSHLSCQGYSRETTPFLDSIKSKFAAISASCWTYPSVASILTGLYPHNHNATIMGRAKNLDKLETFRKLRADVLTLPELLFLLGYRTYFGTAIDLAFYPLRGRVTPKRYDPSTRADELLNDLTKWVAKQKGRAFFAYVHLGDLHTSLNPPDRFRDFFGEGKNYPASTEISEGIENRRLLYDNILRYVDSAIERFFHFLEDTRLVDHTIVVVTGDHGDEFWEHAELESINFYDPREIYGYGHGHNVFNEILEVPLLISGPVPDRKSGHFTSTVDIVPTIIDLLGVSHNIGFDGENIFVETDGERLLLSEASAFGYEKKALVVGRYKLIYSELDRIAWLFDLQKDPKEQHPILDTVITSVFVEKLLRMLRDDERKKVREIARKRNL